MYEQHVNFSCIHIYTLSCVSYGPFVVGNYGPCVTDNSCFQVAFCQQSSPNFSAKNGSQRIYYNFYCLMFKNFMVVVEPVMVVLVLAKNGPRTRTGSVFVPVDQDELLALVLGPF